MASKRKFSDELRRAIERSGKTRYRISKDTGISEVVLCRFVQGQRGMGLKTIDVLWEYLGLRMEHPGAVRKKGR